MASVFDFDRSKVPKITTSRALILTGLQNDFCSPDGKLFTGVNESYFQRLSQLITAFRQHGHVIWVRSEYDPAKPALEQGDDAYSVCLSPTTTAAQPLSNDPNSANASVTPSSGDDTAVNHVDAELFLDADAQGGPATIKDSVGAQYVHSIKHLIKPEDQHIIKHNYSAFNTTDLLMTLRSRIITQIYVCGALSNISAHATALDAVGNGMEVTMVEDCLAYRSPERHELARLSLRRDRAAQYRTSEQVIQMLANPDLVISDDEGVEQLDDYDAYSDLEEYDDFAEKDDVLTADELSSAKDVLRYGQKHNTTAAASDGPTVEASQTERSVPQLDGAAVDSFGLLAPIEVDSDESEGEIPSQITLPMRALSKRTRTRSSGENAMQRMQQRQRFTPPSQSLQSHSPASTLGSTTSAPPHHKTQKGMESWRNRQANASSTSLQLNDSKHDRQLRAQKSWQAIFGSNERHTRSLVSSESVSLAEVEGMLPGFGQKMHRPAVSIEPSTVAQTKRPLFGDGSEEKSAGSSIVYDLLDLDTAKNVFEDLKAEVQWVRMLHQTGEVPRLVCCQGTVSDDGSTPVYRHPSDRTILITPWSARVEEIRKVAEEVVGHDLNHALIQLYRSGHDFISEHSDKTLDIVPGSNIVNVSFGAERTMRLRTKRDADSAGGTVRTTHRIRMPHNSMLIMSLPTNAEYLHGIKADKRREAELSETEAAYDGQRISITFRHIGTFLVADKSKIWGYGATAKDGEHAHLVVSGGSLEAQKLINAFGQENSCSTIQWSLCYGAGSDVLHIAHQGFSAIETAP